MDYIHHAPQEFGKRDIVEECIFIMSDGKELVVLSKNSENPSTPSHGIYTVVPGLIISKCYRNLPNDRLVSDVSPVPLHDRPFYNDFIFRQGFDGPINYWNDD